MAIVLGIDPGSRVTGYGLIETDSESSKEKRGNSRLHYIESGCIRTNGRESLPIRLAEIFSGVTEIIQKFEPSEVAIEKIFMARSADSALKLGHARGVAIVAAVNQDKPIFEYEARKVKQAVVGKGSAGKDQVQHMVRTLLQLKGNPQSDAADALAIAICHINTQYGLNKVSDVNQFRRGRLVRVDT